MESLSDSLFSLLRYMSPFGYGAVANAMNPYCRCCLRSG
jgi:hypothetical protein